MGTTGYSTEKDYFVAKETEYGSGILVFFNEKALLNRYARQDAPNTARRLQWYKLTIPDRKYYLNLDIPINRQSEYVQNCLKALPEYAESDGAEEAREFLRRVKASCGGQAPGAKLSGAGISGIVRTCKDGTENQYDLILLFDKENSGVEKLFHRR